MNYRLSLKLEPTIHQSPRDTYGFHVCQYRVMKCYAANHPHTRPIHVRDPFTPRARMMLVVRDRVEVGRVVSPYVLVCGAKS